MILGYAEPDGTPSPNSFIYVNTFADMSWAIDQAHRLGLALHFAIFEPGFLRNVFSYWRLGRLTPGSFVKFYFGGDNGYMARGRGVTFGLPPTEKALDAYLEMMALEGCDLPWFSAVVGGDLFRTPIASGDAGAGADTSGSGWKTTSATGSRPTSNSFQEMAALCGEVGRPVAGPAQAGEPARHATPAGRLRAREDRSAARRWLSREGSADLFRFRCSISLLWSPGRTPPRPSDTASSWPDEPRSWATTATGWPSTTTCRASPARRRPCSSPTWRR